MSKRSKPVKAAPHPYVQLWRIVDGAVNDCFTAHPEYLASDWDRGTICNSIVKRVVGATYGYAVQTAWGRSVEKTAAEKTDATVLASANAGAECACAREAGHDASLNSQGAA